MEKVKIYESKIVIPTYPEPEPEELPMFAENRVHQRSSGRPYPNKVVMQVDRTHKEDREYKLVTLENEYVKIEILPQIGGRIYSAYDKTTGYDYFYKQHVIKPALIGVLGSWISGGVEFNWPFHHRASGFMPCDFTIEEFPDGSAACHLSEHDPIDRMKGMVSIILRPGETSLETKMRLYNRTAAEKSFLWWENAAVPVNESYQIFFPQDVSYVNFHYLKSRTTYPIAGNGVYNGIPMDTDRDISWHKNTRQATSYFACASDYDYFGGYDHSKACGVVHIGDHHISPGKKMFTWAYCQLSKSWENALTDTDGEYAELMAGSYSDNQPNFSWLAPYETKVFSQHWYPIAKIGTPTFANLNCAMKLDKENRAFKLQSTKIFKNATVKIFAGGDVFWEAACDLLPNMPLELAVPQLPQYVTVSVVADGKTVAQYTEKKLDQFNMPDVITDMPSAAGMNDADELYLAGVHVDQYRDPHTNPDSYWKEALKRKVNHIPSLIAMAKYELGRYCLDTAENFIKRAIDAITVYNERVQSGEVYYTYGRILEAKGEIDKAYNYYYKAYWAADCVAKAMTRIALLDIRSKDYQEAVRHARNALDYGANNNLAVVALVIALRETGMQEEAAALLKKQLEKDSLDHLARYLSDRKDFYAVMDSDAIQTCLDIAFDLSAMGRYADIITLFEGAISHSESNRKVMAYYALGYYKFLAGSDGSEEYKKAETAALGCAYPVRFEEQCILEDVIKRTGNKTAKMLLGCLLYNKLLYRKAAALWEQCDDYISRRNLAVAYFSHLGREADALSIMKALVKQRQEDEELLYETVCLMDKMGISPKEKIDLITSRKVTRDDILTELSKAYNQAFMPDEAIETLLSHCFVPCEGGEHAIADQYMFAYLVKGKTELNKGNYEKAIEFFKKGQVLPQSLGAGIWNHCKRIPLKFYEAICLEQIDEKAKADDIFNYIATTEIEYFSNMHLKELPYFQALSFRHLGEELKGQHHITKYLREWSKIKDTRDNGYFGTTPFFIPFVDQPEKLRKAQYLYLTGLCEDYMGNHKKAKRLLTESVQLNNENMLALFFEKFM
ncbi:MAG: DUF5107 domain-containing protein [Oscillospiraceae bacterium]|nr:DUF5107 domain-containing protein [Oscillospiraceae bacterium]